MFSRRSLLFAVVPGPVLVPTTSQMKRVAAPKKCTVPSKNAELWGARKTAFELKSLRASTTAGFYAALEEGDLVEAKSALQLLVDIEKVEGPDIGEVDILTMAADADYVRLMSACFDI